jgi:hypothetical protein
MEEDEGEGGVGPGEETPVKGATGLQTKKKAKKASKP